jgi:hypothetical protein
LKKYENGTDSLPYIIGRRAYQGYDLLLLPAAHVLCVLHPTSQQWSYIPCTPSEYLILLRLLDAPVETIVPLQVLFPQHYRIPGETSIAIQRHMSRLKKKLPADWRIVCEPSYGYRLHVPPIACQDAPGNACLPV